MSSSLTSVLADPGRLAAVRQTNLLDSPAEDAFDRVARMAARLLEVPIALVPLIEHDRQFFKACVGLPEPWASARQTPLSHSLCQHVLVARQPLAIGDTGRDALARDNPLVRELGLAAYLGVPLIDGSGHALARCAWPTAARGTGPRSSTRAGPASAGCAAAPQLTS
jgi:GAF domain-containing protein